MINAGRIGYRGHSQHRRAVRGRLALPLAAACLLMGLAGEARAQRDTTPTTAYFAYFADYYSGEYGDALKGFQSEGRGSIKGINGRWIDAICYHTMCGECRYQMGQYPEALEQYTAALNLFLKFNDWMIRIQPAPIKPAGPGQIKAVPWGRSSRNSRFADVPDTMMISQGQVNNNDKLQKGGIVSPPVLFPLQVNEIVRCTSLAMRRRRELLGPAGAHDSLNADLLAALSRRPVAPNDWKESWIDIQLALAYSARGDDGQAKALLQRGLVAGGEYDHPLTATALFELGRIAMAQNELGVAARSFEEASYSAYQFGDPMLVEEALRYGHLTHLLGNGKGTYPPLEAAASWARVKGLKNVQASLTILAAESAAVQGRNAEAVELLGTARTTIGNRDMGKGKLGARMHYLAATTLYQQGKIAAGDEALAPVLAYQRGGGSLGLFHIGLADALRVGGKVSDRVAMNLYENVLREPQPADWLTDPLESLSVLVTPHPLPLEHWFEVALERKEYEAALEISDRARRHRFLSTLAMGGRLLNLQWMLEGPDDLLDQQATLQRQDLLARHPVYGELSQKVRGLRAELEQMPLAPEETEQQRLQAEKLANLAAASQLQEVLLREVAVRREPAGLVFPPLRKTKDIQKQLGEKQALLIFFATSQRLYACLMSKDNYPIWEVGGGLVLRKQIEAMLRGMGNYENNHVVALSDLQADSWKKPAAQIAEMLFKGSKARLPGEFEELVIVPDSLLWYLPFEALPVGEGRSPQPLLSQLRVRYAPTIGLALPDGRGRKQTGRTAVVVGKLFPGASEAEAQLAFNDLSQTVKGAVALKSPLPAPSSVYSSLFDRLVVLDDITPSEGGPYAWSPVPLDRGGPGSSLDHWLQLPWGGPDQVALPGFHTPAENSLKKLSLAAAGADMYLSICGLMASGSRTVLISRWRTGGQTSFDLVREFVQELPHLRADEAWQRSVFLTLDAPLNVELEPRIKTTASDQPTTASHPFFWSGYLLVDNGTPPYVVDPKPAEVIQLKAAGKEGEAKKDEAKKEEAKLEAKP